MHMHATMIDTMMELLQTNDNTKPTHLYETIDEKAQQDEMDDEESQSISYRDMS